MRARSSRPADSAAADLVGALTWEINALADQFETTRRFWAEQLGISGPQWTILMAVSELDGGRGVPVRAVAERLQVEGSFVTAQSKLLEKLGLLRRRGSKEDARVVEMMLTDRATKQIAGLEARRADFGRDVFAGFEAGERDRLAEQIMRLRKSLERANQKLVLGI